MNDFKAAGVTTLFVSHNLALIEDFCSRVMVLDSGQRVMDGEPSETIAMYRQMVLPNSSPVADLAAPA
jgi:ABC-type polysaccharide/polyol phosphate transport system ATPase subunit